jgi:toxin ParE1/3/4
MILRNADYVLDRISEAFRKLAELPERGTYPKELSEVGIREFREVFFKPYRIIYRVERRTLYVYLIADGRRDMQALLSRRLLND